MKYLLEVKNTAEIREKASTFLSLFSQLQFFAFDGEMGAGKTTFIVSILQVLGIEEPEGSPTYSIINEYVTKNSENAYHLDCYRLKNGQEALDLGLEELFEKQAWFFVEWAEKVDFLLPENTIWVYIRTTENETREISFEL